jgi:alkane 1-monooxygenase
VAVGDPKRYLWLQSALVPLLPFIGFGLARHTGQGVFWWFTPIIVFVVIPFFDATGLRDAGNPPQEVRAALDADRWYRWWTMAYLPLEYAALLLAGWEWAHAPLSVADRAGLAVSVGVVTGIGINTAHELGHKRERFEVALARIGLAPACYGHFLVEHNRGHHVRVATPEDPASARLGESFWRFWPRSVSGSFRSAWRLESARLRSRGRALFSAENEMLRAAAFSGGIALVLAAAFGRSALLLFLGQAVVGFTLLEIVNYLEHYGLARQPTESGRYEPVAPRHSWNSDQLLSNLALFQLQRHSDHHASPRRRYQSLLSFAESPQLPFGYATMIPLALVPPVWRWLMDDRVAAHYDGDLSLANVHPPAREKLARRTFGTPVSPWHRTPNMNRAPSSPFRGGLSLSMIFASFAWILAYVWGPLPGQEALGGWNYVIPAILFVAPTAVMRTWRGYAAGAA